MKFDEIKKFVINQEISIVDAMEMIDFNSKGILFSVDEKNKLCGCVTDGDIRRWLIKTGDLSSTIANVMSKKPVYLYANEVEQAIDVMKNKSITAVPILNEVHEIIDIIFKPDFLNMKKDVSTKLLNVNTVIMAGGKGTRLYPYTKILPKPLIPIGDTPIIERIMNFFKEYGINKFYLTVNHKKEMIKSYFADGCFSFDIKYVEELKPLGTSGSLKLIDEKFHNPFFVTNCDILILADYADIYDYHIKSENAITIVSALKRVVIPYGVLNSKENGELISLDEKPKLSYFVNTGMYIVNPEVIEYIPDDEMFHMTDLIEKLKNIGHKIGVYPVSEDSFLDMGEFDEMARMEEILKGMNM